MGVSEAVAGHEGKRHAARGYDSQYHGTAEFRGGNCPQSTYYDRGRFGRMFAGLPRYAPDPLQLMRLGDVGGPMDGRDAGPGANADNVEHPGRLPAGFTFLGQFIDHDITFDPTSSLERQVDPEAVSNFRTPTLELDNVYGAGPGANPHLYQRADRDKLLIGRDHAGGETDVPRNPEGTALLGDPRNDENLIVSQLQVAFLKFHNAVVDEIGGVVPAGRSRFEEAQRLVRWHYQHLIVHEFLPRSAVRTSSRTCWRTAAHCTTGATSPTSRSSSRWPRTGSGTARCAPDTRSATRSRDRCSRRPRRRAPRQTRPSAAARGPVASPPSPDLPSALTGGRQIRPEQVIQWRRFFDVGGAAADLQISKRFDAKLSTPLMHLPFASGSAADPKSLAQRNLMRGLTFGLPSGQAVAKAVRTALGRRRATRVDILSPAELAELKDFNLEQATPLWYYVLREAELREKGATLGNVGGRIVAEVFLGLLEGDPQSYLATDREWRPFLGTDGRFTMADLLRVAGVL
jgi:hypothetical protein